MLLRAHGLRCPRLGCLYAATRAVDFRMSHWSATCLSSETSDTNLSMLVDCETSRYLFNCGEGTTRTLIQRKKGFRKFKVIFTTGVDTERSSGLPGLLMTLADSGISKIDVYGPRGLDHFLASTRLYSMRESLCLKSHEIPTSSSSPVYADENVSVFAVPVLPEEDVSILDSDPCSTNDSLKRKRKSDCDIQLPLSKKERTDFDENPPQNDSTQILDPSVWESVEFQPSDLVGLKAAAWRRLIIRHQFPGTPLISSTEPTATRARDNRTTLHFNKRLPRTAREPVSLSYIIMGALGRGKFDVAKANALGLKAGPARGRLAKGETVVTPDGKTITPDMVLGTPPRPEVLVFIDCPSPRHVASLTSSEQFNRFQARGEYPVHCMIHLAGPGVLEDARYQQWTRAFGDNVHHLVTGPGRAPDRIAFTSSAYAQLRLSHLDSDIFRIPKTISRSKRQLDAVRSVEFEDIRPNHFVAMKPARAPLVSSEEERIDLFHPAIEKGDQAITSLLQPKTVDIFQHVRKRVADEESQRQLSRQPGDDIVVTPLGTSSATPSKYRNVSSLIIQIPGSGCILLDCGEGTLGQLRRHFGDEAQHVLRDIRCVFISHIHADHHIGISRLLSQRRKLEPACTLPIYLITNQTTVLYLQEYSDLEDLGLDDPHTGVRVIYSEHAHIGRRLFHNAGNPFDGQINTDNSQSAIHDLNSLLNLTSIATVDVWHRGRCYGIVVKHRDGWSIVYSGDTRPTDKLVHAGRNATLLIHEATLGDDQADMAALKAHSTIGQAIDIAKRMQVRNVLLTHFSARFPKTPQMSNGPTIATGPVVAAAFDHASIAIRDMWKMDRYMPAIEQSFLDSEDPEDEIVEVLGNAP